jgi:hypothetical protein
MSTICSSAYPSNTGIAIQKGWGYFSSCANESSMLTPTAGFRFIGLVLYLTMCITISEHQFTLLCTEIKIRKRGSRPKKIIPILNSR